jgi:catechol 2,3-dioxygenase-like lactoylglutathione lyase family enzyme
MTNALKLNHLNVPARDPAALCQWYVDKLGFVAHGRFLWSGGSLLVFVEGEPISTNQWHFGFQVESLQELHEWVSRLRARDVEVPDIEGDETYSTVYVNDPEGNTFEVFYERTPE